MLVLARKPREKIYIGNNICLTLLHLGFDWVLVVLEVPPEVVEFVRTVYGPQNPTVSQSKSSGGNEILFLYRNQGESFYLSEQIIVTIVEIDRNKVRFGIEAPKEVGIERDNLEGRVNDWSVFRSFDHRG